ncbi:hypothetical protein D9M73_122940 [compost metagenome]
MHDGLDNPDRRLVILRRLEQSKRVLGEARAAIAGSGMQEFGADPIIEADAARNVLNVCTDGLAQVRDLVYEGDLCREKRIRCIFDQLGRAAPGEQNRALVQIKRTIDIAHHLLGTRIVGADDDTIGAFEVSDRSTLAQELRIGHDRDRKVAGQFGQNFLDLIARADRNGRLGHHHQRAIDRRSDLPGGCENIAQIGMAIAAPRWGSNRNEDGICAGHRRLKVGGKRQTSCGDIGRHQNVEARFKDRHLARFQRGDLVGVFVDANHVMAEIGKARAGDKADIARANHRNSHDVSLTHCALRQREWDVG